VCDGYLFGEHGGLSHKQKPYEPSVRVPLLIRGPGLPTRAEVAAAFGGATPLVSRLDLTSTTLGFAGASKSNTDGRDLRNLASGSWRSRILAEQPGLGGQKGWALVREGDNKLIRFDHENQFEFYDLASDSYELDSLAKNPSYGSEISDLQTKLGALRNASGATLRTAEV
jgi:arylsulfatase A-like enzyme